MTAKTPFVQPDRTYSSVPSSLHQPGTGVDEYGDLVLTISDLARIDTLVDDGLVEWWADVRGFRLSIGTARGERSLTTEEMAAVIRHLFVAHAISAAVAAHHDPTVVETLRAVTDAAQPTVLPDIDVLLDADAVAAILTVLLDGPSTTTETLRAAVLRRTSTA